MTEEVAQWGAPLTGAQMKLLRAAGLPNGTGYQFLGFSGEWVGSITHSLRHHGYDDYRLPAGHPAYTLLEKGWLDGRNVRLWNGGETAPDDWDGGDVLLGNGDVIDARLPSITLDWSSAIAKGCPHASPSDIIAIIAYIAKDEVDDVMEDIMAATLENEIFDTRTKRMGQQHQERVTTTADAHETVTIAKMTEADAKRLYPHLDLNTLKDLRLIKEPTREDRFWSQPDMDGAKAPPYVRKWVKDALEFER